MLTKLGCDVETIDLRKHGNGAMLLALWNTMLRCHKNGFVMGAQTKPKILADKELLDRGLLFNATYTIYNVRDVDGIRLLQVRNPAGNHREWEGDYSDASPLWSRRLKFKLGYVKANDNLFWIELRDFCNIFRFLLICKWYDTKKWNTYEYSGQWSLRIKGYGLIGGEAESLQISVKSPSAKVEQFYCTAGGLPSLSSRDMTFRPEDNPYYSLNVFQSTELRITAKQTTEFGQIPELIHAFGVYILHDRGSVTGRHAGIITGDNLIAGTGCAKKERLLSVDVVLSPGNYVILVALLDPGTEGFFNLKVLSDVYVELRQLWPPTPSNEPKAQK